MWTFLNISLEFRAKPSVNPAWPHPSVWGRPFWRIGDSLEPEETISGWDEAAGEDPNWIWLRTRGHNLVMSCQSKGGPAFKHSLLYLLFYSKWKHHLLNVVYSQWAQPYSQSHRFGSLSQQASAHYLSFKTCYLSDYREEESICRQYVFFGLPTPKSCMFQHTNSLPVSGTMQTTITKLHRRLKTSVMEYSWSQFQVSL